LSVASGDIYQLHYYTVVEARWVVHKAKNRNWVKTRKSHIYWASFPCDRQ